MLYGSDFDCLTLPTGPLGRISRPRRLDAIREATDWPAGSDPDHPIYHVVYSHGPYEVCLAKPGKESLRVGDSHNPHDMLPCVRCSGRVLDYAPTFRDIFNVLQRLALSHPEALEVIACLFVRGAFMLDHKRRERSSWRFAPPREVIDEVEARTPSTDNLPTQVFLQLVDALAWNEDVKYYHRYGELRSSGRQNTLMTCAHIIAVMMGRADIVDFAMAMAKGRGVAPMTQSAARDSFPLLKGRLWLAAEETRLWPS